MRLWKGRLDIEDAAAVTAWLYRAATNLVLDRLRSRRLRGAGAADETLSDLLPDEHPSAEGRSHSRRVLRALIDETPPDELSAAVLTRLDGLTQPEVAEVLGKSERTVRRLLVSFDERLVRFRKPRAEA